jgi:biopolymer transport protein ExbD
MAFSSNSSGGIMAEINVTPLVDVMLVLLIIFMITAPLMQHKINVELPEKTMVRTEDAPQAAITLSVKSSGELFWNDVPLQKTNLDRNLRIEARREPQPMLEIRADKTTRYGILQEVMGIAKTAGMKKIGFITTPEAGSN